MKASQFIKKPRPIPSQKRTVFEKHVEQVNQYSINEEMLGQCIYKALEEHFIPELDVRITRLEKLIGEMMQSKMYRQWPNPHRPVEMPLHQPISLGNHSVTLR